MSVVIDPARRFEVHVPLVIVGAGACGLIAALAAHDAGAQVLVLERDAAPAGSTALSSGFIPACGTRVQREHGIEDSVELMLADVQRKNHGEADESFARAVCAAAGSTIDWLADRHAISFVLVEGFLYPGHSVLRMHAVPEMTGAALMGSLLRACSAAGIDILSSAQVTTLYADDIGRVTGAAFTRPDGATDEVGCGALMLACSGFGGNRAMVREHLPEIADALFLGHVGNQGDAVRWGAALGAAVRHMTAYQGHGSVATPHGILITWALMMEGGIQVNSAGRRFSNEHTGYSEQCLPVTAQPGGVAWCLYDERLHRLGMTFEDYRNAASMGAVKSAPTIVELASECGLPGPALSQTVARTYRYASAKAVDSFGRDFSRSPPLAPPFFAVKVTGALFHTQGGLVVDGTGRVQTAAGPPLPNLFAGGGAACGVSGAHVWGYLSGNGLLAAASLGRLAGEAAARVSK